MYERVKPLWEGVYTWGYRSSCDLRMYEPLGGPWDGATVVVATEMDWNQGSSITNDVESLASSVFRRHREIAIHSCLWLEHYPPRPGSGKAFGVGETFSRVKFQKIEGRSVYEPVWEHYEKKAVMALLGDEVYITLQSPVRHR